MWLERLFFWLFGWFWRERQDSAAAEVLSHRVEICDNLKVELCGILPVFISIIGNTQQRRVLINLFYFSVKGASISSLTWQTTASPRCNFSFSIKSPAFHGSPTYLAYYNNRSIIARDQSRKISKKTNILWHFWFPIKMSSNTIFSLMNMTRSTHKMVVDGNV